jgi:AAA15 family ATPase/GTPase
MLTQVAFKNIKSLADLTLALEPLTVLVGPNGCGKSTVLDQIEKLCEMSRPEKEEYHSFGTAGRILKDFPFAIYHAYQQEGPMSWSGSRGGEQFEVQIENWNKPDWYLNARTSLKIDAKEKAITGKATQEDLAVFLLLLTTFSQKQLRLRLDANIIAEDHFVGESLEPDGRGLAALLAEFGLNEPEAYKQLQEDLRSVVPHFQRLVIRQNRRKSETEETITEFHIFLELEGAGRIPASMASEGTLLALGLLSAIHIRDLPDIVLIDDIDRGLHLSAQYKLIEAIRRIQLRRPELQVICTSHSPDLLDSFKPEEVRVMALTPGGHTRCRPLTDHPDFQKWKSMLRTGEFWATTGEDWVLEQQNG